MCLSVMLQGPNHEAKGIGYKLVKEVRGHGFIGPYQYYPYNMVGWNIDTSGLILNGYRSGFHVYDKLDSARYELAEVFLGQCQIWEVECRILRASGTQYGVPVSVWKEMRFIREVSLHLTSIEE